MSTDVYPHKKYPRFCFGTSYVMSIDALKVIISVYHNVTLIKLEDVSLGILTNLSDKIKLQNIPHWRSHGYKGVKCPFTYTQHGLKAYQIKLLWLACYKLMKNVY